MKYPTKEELTQAINVLNNLKLESAAKFLQETAFPTKSPISFTVNREVEIPVRYLEAFCEVRYWEDGIVNGKEDDEGSLIPFRKGNMWNIVIDLYTGKVENWPEGFTADVHYKVCDAGEYKLFGPEPDREFVTSYCGYVPSILYPGADGYGDYVILKIDNEGKIANWPPNINLKNFYENRD